MEHQIQHTSMDQTKAVLSYIGGSWIAGWVAHITRSDFTFYFSSILTGLGIINLIILILKNVFKKS